MSSPTTTKASSVILNGPGDWVEWLEVVKSTAATGQVWEYVDPSQTEVPTLQEPQLPEPKDIKPAATTIQGLSEAERLELREQRELYRFSLTRYDRRKNALAELQRHIQSTVARPYVHHTFKCDSVHQMLINLQKRLKPRDDVRRLQLIDQYRELQKPPTNKNIDTWLLNWEKVYKEASELDEKIVDKHGAVQDFLRAVSDMAPDFASFWTNTIQSQDDLDKRPDLNDVVDRFRTQRQILGTGKKSGSSHTAFTTTTTATLQGQEEATPKKKLTCLCKEEHHWTTCPYLGAKKPDGWKEDPAIRKHIDEQMKNPGLKAAVKRAFARKAKKTEAPSETSNDTATEEIQHAGFAVSAFTTPNQGEYALRNSYILDSGADTHVCNDVSRAISPLKPAPAGECIATGNGLVPVIGYGDIAITAKAPAPRTKQTVKLLNVAFVPSFFTNVVSLKRLIKGGIDWLVKENKLMLGTQIFCLVEEKHGQWVLEFNPIHTATTFAVGSKHPRISKAPANIWHDRLAHCGPEVLKRLPTAVTGAILTEGPLTNECETCGVSKAHKIISRRPPQQAEAPFDRVYWDLIHMEEGFNGDRYISHFIDDHTSMNYVYTLPSRDQDQLSANIKEFTAMVERQYNRKAKIFHMDNESGLGKRYEKWAKDNGIRMEDTAPYTPDQNGRSERSGGVILTKARCIRIRARIPEDMWPEIVKAAGYILNRTLAKHLKWKSPYEFLQICLNVTAIQPDISHLRVYGCKAYVMIPREKIPRTQKLAPRAEIGYLIGYDSTNIFRIWIPKKGEIRRSRDVIFDENTLFNPQEITDLPNEEIELVDIPQLADRSPTSEEIGDCIIVDTTSTNRPSSDGTCKPTSDSSHTATDLGLPTPETTPQPEQVSEQQLETQSQDRPSREIFGDVGDERNVLEGARSRKPSSKRKEAYATALNQAQDLPAYYQAFAVGLRHPRVHYNQLPQPPRNWAELQRHPHKEGFIEAAQIEYQTLQSKNTFREVSKADIATKIIPLTWVFTYKLDSDGYLLRYKARICVRGDLQPVTEQDTYAATLAVKIFRFLMALTAAFDLDTWHADVTNAFINSWLDETVYCNYPDGFEQLGKCLQLLRALYGLRRSPLLWQQEFSNFLHQLGLRNIPEEPCLFITDNGIILFFYVDDIVVLSRKERSEQAHSIREALLERYEMKDLGELRWFLGIRVIRDREQCKLWLCQDSYVEKITNRFNLQHRKHPATPLPTDTLMPSTRKASPQDVFKYQGKVGSLNYATTTTRPDCARAASNLAEFLTNPSQQHQDAAEQAIIYLNGTKYYAIEYSASATNQELTLTWPNGQTLGMASDAAYADCSTTRRSSEGYLFKLFGGAIDWRSTKQKTVTTSTTEAELLALSHAAKEALWWNRLFKDLGFNLGHELTIHCDNQQTIRLLVKDIPTLITKLKHVDIHRHWLRELAQTGSIKISWIPTNQMPADGLTKALTRQKHQSFVKLLGLVDLSNLGVIENQGEDQVHNAVAHSETE